VPDGRVPFISIPAGGVPEGWVPFICMPAGGEPDGWVVFPCILAAGVPDGVMAEPDVAVSCGTCVLSACVGAEDADVLPPSWVQPAIKIPATRIADAMIMMIVLFFMRFCVSLTFLMNTGTVFWAGDPARKPLPG
jgi:hypothetical protein